MNHRKTAGSKLGAAIAGLGALLLFTSSAGAQTGPALLIKPWDDKNQVYDGSAEAYFFQSGHTPLQFHDDSFNGVFYTNDRYRLSEYDLAGRIRILPGNEISPCMGYEFLLLDSRTTDRHVPNTLSDESVAIGTRLAKYQGWIVEMTLGFGYTGSNAFDVGSGWYGKADLIISKEFDENNALMLLLDYDGHRSYLPDTPLPGIAFSHKFGPQLQVIAGWPYSSVEWKPIEHVDLKAEYNAYTDLRFTIGYEFVKACSVYGTAGYVRDVFREDGLRKDRRLLFFQRRAEVGIRYMSSDNLTLKVGVGYGWDGSYTSGFDVRSTSFVADFSDSPYMHGSLEFRF